MAATKFLRQIAGDIAEVFGLQTSAGAADGGKIVALDDTGRLDNSMMPTGVGPDTETLTASEALAAGDLVNLWNSTGVKVRKADASGGVAKRADGFVLSAVTNAGSALVYFIGRDTSVAGLTPGDHLYLSGATPGGLTNTAPTTAGHIVQKVGVAISATDANITPLVPVILA